MTHQSCKDILTTAKNNGYPLDSATYLWRYDERAQEIMVEAKYKRSYQLLKSLTPHIVKRLNSMRHPLRDLEDVILIPIPLHRRRYFERGFDHTKIIAEQFSKALMKLGINNAIDTQILRKSRYSPRQASLSRDERHLNMKESFNCSLVKIEDLDCQNILLIDDVMTTGATIFEAGRAIKKVRPDLNISGLTLFRGNPVYSPDLKADHTPTAFRLFVTS